METIKDIGKFIKWQWNKLDAPSKFALCMLSWFATLPIGLFIVGFTFLGYWFGFAVVVGVCFLIKAVAEVIMESWRKFQNEQEAERQRVVDRLRGDVVYDRAEDILSKLKARHSGIKKI